MVIVHFKYWNPRFAIMIMMAKTARKKVPRPPGDGPGKLSGCLASQGTKGAGHGHWHGAGGEPETSCDCQWPFSDPAEGPGAGNAHHGRGLLVLAHLASPGHRHAMWQRKTPTPASGRPLRVIAAGSGSEAASAAPASEDPQWPADRRHEPPDRDLELALSECASACQWPVAHVRVTVTSAFGLS
jgi:hypothetical protein